MASRMALRYMNVAGQWREGRKKVKGEMKKRRKNGGRVDDGRNGGKWNEAERHQALNMAFWHNAGISGASLRRACGMNIVCWNVVRR